tara:strand:- start:3899 stop:4321 length:423 start_codon:yes stop_codon:yes gene_type:complete
LQEHLKTKGRLAVYKNGELVGEYNNLVVSAGKNFVASRLAGVTDDVMSHMAIGTDSTAADAADTTLATEAGRVALTSTNVVDNEITYTATFGAGVGTGAIVEAGVLNASSAGTLLCRTVFSAINKGASDSITITWTVTVS